MSDQSLPNLHAVPAELLNAADAKKVSTELHHVVVDPTKSEKDFISTVAQFPTSLMHIIDFEVVCGSKLEDNFGHGMGSWKRRRGGEAEGTTMAQSSHYATFTHVHNIAIFEFIIRNIHGIVGQITAGQAVAGVTALALKDAAAVAAYRSALGPGKISELS